MRKAILFLSMLFAMVVRAEIGYYELVDSADYYINKEEYAKAEETILRALRLEPSNYNNSLLLSNLGTIQRRQGRLEEAVKNYTFAIYMTPNAVTLLKNRLFLSTKTISSRDIIALSSIWTKGEFQKLKILSPS